MSRLQVGCRALDLALMKSKHGCRIRNGLSVLGVEEATNSLATRQQTWARI